MDPLPAEIGELIGGYRLEQLIGRGAMGSVFLATHAVLQRKAAVKVLESAYVQDQGFVARFFQEAKVVSRARHANIVDVFDFVNTEAPRRVAYVMEWIDGPSLRSLLLEHGALDPDRAIRIALELANALDSVHRLGVVHRDLKPENVLLSGPDLSTPKVLDFGIAKVNGREGEDLTQTGIILGTPSYMAPEQIAGAAVTGATDVYALGELLYEMLSGARLYTGERVTVLRSKLLGEVPPLDAIAAAPVALRRLIRACLAVEPRSRPPIAQVEERLQRIRDHQDVPEANAEQFDLTHAELELLPSGPIALGPDANASAQGLPWPALITAESSVELPSDRTRSFWLFLSAVLVAGLVFGVAAVREYRRSLVPSASADPPPVAAAQRLPPPVREPPREAPPEPRVRPQIAPAQPLVVSRESTGARLDREGLEALEKRDYETAEKLLTECVVVHEFAPCHRELGRALDGRDDHRAAVELRRYLELEPDARDRAIVERRIRNIETRGG
jgi:serine/threonine-protein kinase